MSACDLTELTLQATPGELEDGDRQWLLSVRLGVALVGLEVLHSSDTHDPSRRAQVSAIAQVALRASTCATKWSRPCLRQNEIQR